MRSDEELMEEITGGDMEAFGELVRRHEDRAWRIAYHYVGDRAEAEDLAQEAFLKLLEAAPNYRSTAQFTTYFYRIIANLCIDHHRKKRPLYSDQLPPQESPTNTPEDQLTSDERDRAIQHALKRLPDRQRMATVLRYYEDLSLSEIADAMETTYKAVEGLLSRARHSLESDLRDFS